MADCFQRTPRRGFVVLCFCLGRSIFGGNGYSCGSIQRSVECFYALPCDSFVGTRWECYGHLRQTDALLRYWLRKKRMRARSFLVTCRLQGTGSRPSSLLQATGSCEGSHRAQAIHGATTNVPGHATNARTYSSSYPPSPPGSSLAHCRPRPSAETGLLRGSICSCCMYVVDNELTK